MKVNKRTKTRVKKRILRSMEEGEKYSTNSIKEMINRSHKFTKKMLEQLNKNGLRVAGGRKIYVNKEKNGRTVRWFL